MFRPFKVTFFILLTVLFFQCSSVEAPPLKVDQWEKLTLSFTGPATSEKDQVNPFLNYRLNVTFSNGDETVVIPGFYAADGNASESSAETGAIWQVRFRPHTPGIWSYEARFREGEDIAISDETEDGAAISFDGHSGTIEVSPAPNHPGRLVMTDDHYLKYAAKDKYFLKGGADSPENFLGYFEFDGTYKGEKPEAREGEATAKDELHHFLPHHDDWNSGDPTWQNDKGKNIIGALNYLAGKGMNSVYFLTMNIQGDGKDVWPYTSYEERLRFDCSKLDQWEIVFDHMDALGLMLHVVTSETENETLLDDGDTKQERKLYYRELIARFGHHLGVTWNLGEENGPASWTPIGQTTKQREDAVKYIKTHDPYKNMVVIHSHSHVKEQDEVFKPLLGFPFLDGMSLQISKPIFTNKTTKKWRDLSRASGKNWIVSMDEVGPHFRGVDPDDRVDNNQDTLRHTALWGNLMAGGAGIEWYFGYRNHNNDLGCEDWRSRDRLWDYTNHALTFFHDHLPFYEMEGYNDLLTYDGTQQAFCFAKAGETYAIYFPDGGHGNLDLANHNETFSVQWYNPRTGGALSTYGESKVEGGKSIKLTTPKDETENDWVALLKKIN